MKIIDDYIKEHGYIVFPTRKEYEEFERLLTNKDIVKSGKEFEPLNYRGIKTIYHEELL